ncbi:tetratricopeptide repeat family protein, putative [Plasmodium ovale]|uniref:peptidylprolyl isomerase n=2 Tax=Plasmodium ovale TaxID=36330 RepID=A0A1A8W8Q1_PLAOA|nr:hypothetical protein, conserved [Plasmodium ovale curtisi]SBS98222.1 hypothetical protein, conserved [Plasmodium ovale curtisi]SCQ16944.1 tetratricopeptide repeat family protein, putative [Plasmodium ovale]
MDNRTDDAQLKRNNTLERSEANADTITDLSLHDKGRSKLPNACIKEQSSVHKEGMCSAGENKEEDKEERDKRERVKEGNVPVEAGKEDLPIGASDVTHFEDEKESKDDANEMYNQGNYENAVKIWERGLRPINYVLSKKEELNSERLEAFQKLHSTYCSNIAQGYMKLCKYSECVKYSLLAQKYDKKNVKIYFRLAKGYFMLGEYDHSIQVLNEGIKINNDNSLINLMGLVKKKKQAHLEKEKHMMKYIFERLQEKPLINDEENARSFFRSVYSFLSFLLLLICAFLSNSSGLLIRFVNRCRMRSGKYPRV